MASKIKHSFKEGCLALINGGWANRVARFCSYWCGVNGIDVLVPENPSPNAPVKVGLNIANATKLIVNEMTGNLGIKFDAAAHPLQLRLVTKTQNNEQVADYAAVYLPTTTIRIKGTDYTVTGVTAIEDGGGWYKINSRTTGYFYLNQSGSTTNLVWATSKLSDTTKASYFVGRITYSQQEGWNVIQYCRPMSGKAVAQDEGGSGGELPADNLTGTLTNGCLVKGTGSHTATSSVYAPPANHQLVVAPESMSGNANCLPMVTQNASLRQSAALTNSGIAVIDMTTKKAIRGINVKIDVPSGATLQEWDNVAVAADGTLKLDQTDYAWFDPDEDSIIDEGIVVANGTDGKVKTLEKLSASKVKIDEKGTTLDDLINADTSKIADDALDLFEKEGGELYIDFDNTDAYVGDGNALVGTDGDGLIQEACDIPQKPATDKVLMVLAGTKVPSFENASSLSGAVPTAFQLSAVVNQAKTSITELRVYLPSLEFGWGNSTYKVMSGSTTGYLTAVSGQTGWYKINGITSGNIFLVDCSASTTSGSVTIKAPRVKFATDGLSTINTLSFKVASVSYTAGQAKAVITQCGAPMKANAEEKIEHDAQTCIDNMLPFAPTHDTAEFLSQGHTLNQDKWIRGMTVLGNVTVNGDRQTISAVTDADGHQQLCGVKFRCFSRTVRAPFNTDFYVYRELEFDKNGMLRLVTEEKGAMGVLNYNAG